LARLRRIVPAGPVEIGKISDFIFYWTRLTGFTRYFFGFPDESQKFQSPSANEKIVARKLKFIE
jgi:hypothetical protein